MTRPLPKATPALAKAVWENQRRPSARSVARALTASGRPVHFATIARWKAKKWRADTNDHPLDVARATLESITPLVSSDPQTTIQDIKDEGSSTDLEQLSDAELLRKTATELCTLSVMVHRTLREELGHLVTMRTDELGFLIQSLSACLQAVRNAYAQADDMENGPPLPGSRGQPA
jgi:hypothetical protein